MFDKLITKLKDSLPGAKKNAESEDELENEEESVEESDSEGEAVSAEDEKKKKISMMIRVVVILLLGYLAVDQFILNPQGEQSVDQLTANIPKKRKKPKPVESTEENVVADQKTTTPDANEKKEEPIVSNEPPVENINIANRPVEDQPAVDSSPATDSAPAIDTSTTTESPTVGETPSSEVTQAPTTGENAMDSRLDQLIENVETKEKKSPNLAEKIAEEATMVAPPPYDVLGRGLVYNCKDKFWACIDKPNYVTCNKNMKWNSSKGNPQECVVQNVYNSDEDCIKIQKYNVSSNQPTAFCK